MRLRFIFLGRTFSFAVLSLLVYTLWPVSIKAQELRASVRISTDALGTVDRSKYEALEKKILSVLNETRFTNLNYKPNERIVCTFSLNVLEVEDEVRHQAELSITASRTVYGTNYTTTTYAFRDKELIFDYTGGETLEYNPQSVDNSLTATLAIHAMLIIACDLDSYSPLGGDLMKEPITALLSTSSSQPEWLGWRTFDSDKNRASLAEALNSPQALEVRRAWYSYHLTGLDIASKRFNEARDNILDALEVLKAWKVDNFRSPLLTLWETTKIDELANLYSEAPAEEKQKVHTLLLDLFPTRVDALEKLKR